MKYYLKDYKARHLSGIHLNLSNLRSQYLQFLYFGIIQPSLKGLVELELLTGPTERLSASFWENKHVPMDSALMFLNRNHTHANAMLDINSVKMERSVLVSQAHSLTSRQLINNLYHCNRFIQLLSNFQIFMTFKTTLFLCIRCQRMFGCQRWTQPDLRKGRNLLEH